MIESLLATGAGPYAMVVAAALAINGAAMTIKKLKVRVPLQVASLAVAIASTGAWLYSIFTA